MKTNMYALIHNHQVCKLTASLLLASVLGFVLTQGVQAQNNIPPASKPSLVGIWCPSCKGYIPCPSGKKPSKCPHCPYSFVQGTKPRPAPVKPLKPLPGPRNTQPQPVPDQPDDRLYYDGIVTPGGLRTRHFEADGLPARAEEWGKEMRQIKDQSQKKQEARDQALENDKKTLLAGQENGTAFQQLKNPFADDPNVVDLRGSKTRIPRIPSGPDDKGASELPLGVSGPEKMSLAEEQFLRYKEAESWGLRNLWDNAVALEAKGELELRYGNWYGKDWSAGITGTEGPVDSLDAICMLHDFAYNAAVKQGEIYGRGEEQRLKAMADAIAVEAVSKLKPDPSEWDQKPKDLVKADMYRDALIYAFGQWTGPGRDLVSKVETPFNGIRDVSLSRSAWSLVSVDVDYRLSPTERNKYDKADLILAASSLKKTWEMKQRKIQEIRQRKASETDASSPNDPTKFAP